MAERGRDLTNILFDTGSSPAATPARYQDPQQWRAQLGLDDLEDREGLPRGTMTAVLTRESNGYPTAKSPKGAQGLFEFMPATAKSYGIDPLNPQQAADAAAKELGSHYKRYEGDLQQTLAAWNWGSGNLQKQGIANAPKETRNFITWVSGLLSPRSAEAASPQGGRDLTHVLFGDSPQVPARSRLEELEAELARRDAQHPPTQVPARSRLEELEAHLAHLEGQAAPPPGRSRLEELEAHLARRDAPQAPPSTSATSWQENIFGRTPPQGTTSASGGGAGRP